MPYLPSHPMAPLTFRPASNIPAAVAAASNETEDVEDIIRSEESPTMEDAEPPQPQSPEDGRAQRLRAKNRRKRYLELHPEYLSDPSLELADPLLYDRAVRRFQTAAERQAEGLRKGFSGTMSADLWRAEAKKDALHHPNPHSLFTYDRGPRGEILEEDKDEKPMSKEEGRAWWDDEMTQRFLRGEDEDFEYKDVDESDRYDDPEEERDIQEAYFESMDSDFDSEGEGKEKVLHGETGIQDY